MSKATESRYGFTIGSRVVASEEAFVAGLFKRKHAPVFGTVKGFSRSVRGIRVLRDNVKTVSSYHIDFWEPVK